MNVALDAATHALLRVLADREGVSISALVEAFARSLTTADREAVERQVEQAREIDTERRRRTQPVI